MDLLNTLKPNRWKVIVSLLPFVFPFVQVWISFQTRFDLYLDVDNFLYDIEEYTVAIILLAENVISAPLQPMLSELGWWSNNILTAFPNGPLLPGSFAVAVTYSVLVYIIWSFMAAWRRRSKP